MTANADETHSLLTPKALALSLAPPRAPPVDSSHHQLLRGKDPSSKSSNATVIRYPHRDEASAPTHHDPRTTGTNKHTERVKQHLDKVHQKGKTNNHHPHLSSGSEVKFSRYLAGKTIPQWWQNKNRDNGFFRSISDGLVTSAVPLYALKSPKAAMDFVRLTAGGASNNDDDDDDLAGVVRKEVEYIGAFHENQKMDLFLPNNSRDIRGLVFFVHGGAWGSGDKWMYRLVATTFLQQNLAVAIVGYRVYPDGNVMHQVEDLEMAAETLVLKYPHLFEKKENSLLASTEGGGGEEKKNDDDDWLGLCLMGHSSGGHIALLLLVHQIERKIRQEQQQKQQQDANTTDKNNNRPTIEFDSFVGLAGVYSISKHFDYEANRGVEEVSPMKPACGYTRQAFDYHSPHLRFQQLLALFRDSGSALEEKEQQQQQQFLADYLPPRILFVHGVEDDVVPFTSSTDAAFAMRNCGVVNCLEYYLPRTGHIDLVLHLMEGGATRDVMLQFLNEKVVVNDYEDTSRDNNPKDVLVVAEQLSSKL